MERAQEPRRTSSPTTRPDRPQPLGGMLTTREASVQLGMSERAVRRAIADGRLPAVRAGSVYRLFALEVQRFAVRHMVQMPGPVPGAASPPPVPASRFIGREAELQRLIAFLVDPTERLLTLTGPGGIGKTRLALEAATLVQHRFPDGKRVVFLETTRDPALVPAALAQALGVMDAPDEPPLDALHRALRDAHLLLILDNVEQILSAAPVFAGLLLGAPGLRILATSRAPLHLSAERVVPLAPMSIAGGIVTPERLLASDAGQLFVDRAERWGESLLLDDEVAQAIADICARVDGLPLGIELAAAATRVFTVHELRHQLTPCLPLLTDGPRDALPRHATLRNAIAWSYDLLPLEAQWLFRQLAVCVGGCTAETVMALATDATPPLAPDDARAALATLVDYHLVRREAASGTRYTLLETIREFGLEQLAASGELHEAQMAHAATMLGLAEDLLPVGSIYGRSSPLARLAAEQGNMRAALAWFQQQESAASFVDLVAALGLIWFPYRASREGAPWLAAALARADERRPLPQARLLIGLGAAFFSQGSYGEIPALLDRAEVLLAQAANPPLDLAILGTLRGATNNATGSYDEAEQALQQARVIAGQIPDPALRAGMTGRVLSNLAVTAGKQGRLDAAVALAESAAACCAAAGCDLGLALVQLTAAQILSAAGQSATALQGWDQGLTRLGHDENSRVVAEVLARAAAACVERGNVRTALQLFGAVDALRERENMAPAWQSNSPEPSARVMAERRMGSARAARLIAAGQAMSTQEALACLHAAALDAAPHEPALTPRQHEILTLLAEGQTDREIAERLFLSRRTVSWHLEAIFDYFSVMTRGDAVARARAEGLVPA